MKTQKNFSIISWTLLTTSGFILGILLILVLALNIVGLNPYLQSPKGFSMSLCTGFMQWLLLRKHIDNSFKWVWFSIVGITSVFILFDIIIPIFKLNIQYLRYPLLILYPLFTIGSLLSGYLQYRYILSKVSKKAANWNLYNLIGWSTCILLTSVVYIPYFKTLGRNIEVLMIAFIVCGPALGIITGKGLKVLLENKRIE